MKSVPPAPVFVVLLSFTIGTHAQGRSEEQAIRKMVADLAASINNDDVKDLPRCSPRTPTSSWIASEYLKEVAAYCEAHPL